MKVNEKLNNAFETAQQRSSIYGFLARMYSKEVSQSLLDKIREPKFLSMLSEIGARFDDDFSKKADNGLVEDLAEEYTRLFLGPGKHISPHESVHHERDDNDWGRLWGQSTVEVKKFIESAGLSYKPEYSGLPDHISVEFEFMQELAKEEASAWKKNDTARAQYCRQIEQKFMDWHMSRWIPGFCDKVMSEAEMTLYKEMARVTRSFLEFDERELSTRQ